MTKRIAVIGGGVTGLSIAWHLAEREAGEIVVLERDRLGSGTTWHSAGNITWKPSQAQDAPIAYMLDLVERLEQETDQSTGWLTTGRLFMARSADAMRQFEDYHNESLDHGVEGLLLSPKEIVQHHPLVSPEALAGAWLNPRSGRLNPADLVAAFAKGARSRGVGIVEQCAVESLEISAGRVRGVRTSDELLSFDNVVVATGMWSRNLLAASGVGLAHGACEHFYAIAAPTPRLARNTPSFVCAESLIYGREEVGGFLVGFFDRNAKVLDVSTLPEPFTFTLLDEDWDQVGAYYEAAAELFPALRDAPIKQLVNGPESFTPDGHPLAGPVDGIDGLYVACAMNSAGVTYSGMMGHLITDLICDQPLRFQEFDCDPGRFGPDAADPAWVDRQMPGAPSHFYLSHQMPGE